MELGSHQKVFQSKYPQKCYLSETWLLHWWEFLSAHDFTCEFYNTWNISPQREHDHFIMDAIYPIFTKNKLKTFNLCRLFMKVSLLSDITKPYGITIKRHIVKHTHPVDSLLVWPEIPNPPAHAWRVWTRGINYLRNNILIRHLGDWKYIPRLNKYKKSWCTMSNSIYIVEDDHIIKFSHDQLSHNRYVKQKNVLDIPHNVIPVSIYKRKNFISISTQTNTYHTLQLPPNTLMHNLPKISVSKNSKKMFYNSLPLLFV